MTATTTISNSEEVFDSFQKVQKLSTVDLSIVTAIVTTMLTLKLVTSVGMIEALNHFFASPKR
jgi:hypothetical protein